MLVLSPGWPPSDAGRPPSGDIVVPYPMSFRSSMYSLSVSAASKPSDSQFSPQEWWMNTQSFTSWPATRETDRIVIETVSIAVRIRADALLISNPIIFLRG